MSEERKIFMKHCMKVIMSLALVVVCFSFAFAGTASAHTATQDRATNGPPVVIENVLCCGESDVPLREVQLDAQTSGSISESFTVSNSISASVTVSAKVVSATLGFDVSQSYSLSASCTATNTTSQYQYLIYETVYKTYDFELWQSGQKIGIGSAEDFSRDLCTYSGSTLKPLMG